MLREPYGMTSLPIKLLLIALCWMPIMADDSVELKDLYSETTHVLLNDPVAFEPEKQELNAVTNQPAPEVYPEEEVAILPDVENQESSSQVLQEEIEDAVGSEEDIQANESQRIIRNIFIQGNKNVPFEAILNKIPYHIAEIFTPLKSKQLITNLYDMGYFSNIELEAEPVGKDGLNLYIILHEKKLLRDVIFKGNKHLPEKDIKKKINFAEKPAIDESDLNKYVIALKKLYREKNYHHVDIKAELIADQKTDKVDALFTIEENKTTQVQRVFFEGNKAFPSKQLRSLIFTREDWILGFMDRSGSYIPEAIEADRHTIENFYQSNGYLNAKVTNVDIVPDPKDPTILRITFHILEGDIYTISEIKIPGNTVIPLEQLESRLPIKVGDLYSRDKIRDSIEAIRMLLGEFGYIYADVDPAPEPDDETKTVKLTFFIELGDKLTIRNIKIGGNEKTRQKVILRKIPLAPGDLLTTQRMELAKSQIEQLGYFDQQNGVSWKIKRISRDMADLELFVREVKTGRVDAQLGFGGSPKDLQNPTESLRIGGSISDTNLFGLGIGFNLSGEFSKQERQLLFNITEPWLFDRPIFAAIDIAIKKSIYEDIRLTTEEVREQLVNGSLSLGFIAQKLNQTRIVAMFGIEGLHYNNAPQASPSQFINPKEFTEYNAVLRRRFPNGSYVWTAAQASQDFRNHPMHPSRGYQWLGQTRFAIPSNGQFHIASNPNASPYNFGFWKIDFDASYFTPLIGERDLVFYLHTHFGIVGNFPGKVIPFRELYHIGGPASVRGFLFGEIGPTFRGDSIGAKKAFWINSEFIFPVAPDFSIKGVLFYDGGAGWDTPDAAEISRRNLRNNKFNYRHAIGFGVRLLRPTPVKIDWGFKLDKRRGESPSQVHLSMSHDF